MNRYVAGFIGLLALQAGCAPASPPTAGPAATAQVFAAERAFAATMAERDLDAFAEFVAEDAVFFSGSTALRGKLEIVAAWSPFFAGEAAPFSWGPDQVEVLASARLALSTGLVKDPSGNVAARFNSIWRQDAPGVWRVVFDKGGPAESAATQ